MQDVSIDLVIDVIPQDEAEILTPADRIEVAGIPAFDYRIYPAASSLADKLCAMLEKREGRPSSRTKDLVDVVVYALMIDIDGTALRDRVRTEAGARRMSLPDRFSVPSEWHDLHASRFGKTRSVKQAFHQSIPMSAVQKGWRRIFSIPFSTGRALDAHGITRISAGNDGCSQIAGGRGTRHHPRPPSRLPEGAVLLLEQLFIVERGHLLGRGSQLL